MGKITVFDDDSRVAALHELGILDTPQEERFERLTRLACATFGAPIALVSLVDRERQWFKSHAGLDAEQTPRSVAFCSHTVEQGEMLVVPDATRDARFAANPLVTGEPHIRFYAGQPVFAPNGHPVGTLCIIDRVARQFDQRQRDLLRDLAKLVEDEINKAAIVRARERAEATLRQLNSELERRVEERTELLDAILGSIDVAVMACGADGATTLFNRAARELHGLPPGAIDAAQWAAHCDVFEADGATRMRAQDTPLLRALGGETVSDAALVIVPKDRPARVLLASGRPLFSSAGAALGAVVAMKDVTESRLHEQQLKALALTDSLTGVANRRSYDLLFDAAIKRAHRSGERLALMYLDIDHFKQVNDTHGHAGGDAVLKEFARRLVAAVRKTDTVCRLAGDEFTIILEGVHTLEQCETIGHTILEAIRVPFTIGAKAWPVSASIGIAWSAGGQLGARRLADSADAALYQAKAAGRNRFAVQAQAE